METGITLFLDRLDQLRGRKPITRFAKECNIGNSTMRNYLEGNTPPTLPALYSIARANNVTVGWLVGDPETGSRGHAANGVSGVMQAGGTISGSSITTAGSDFTDLEQQLIDKLRQVGSPVVINKIMEQLQDLEDYVLGSGS